MTFPLLRASLKRAAHLINHKSSGGIHSKVRHIFRSTPFVGLNLRRSPVSLLLGLILLILWLHFPFTSSTEKPVRGWHLCSTKSIHKRPVVSYDLLSIAYL